VLPWLLAVAGTLANPACSADIDLGAPAEVKVERLADGPPGTVTVEVSWKLCIRVDGYVLHYGEDAQAGSYGGRGLSMLSWDGGCGQFAGAALADGGAGAAAGKVIDSPVWIPEVWCLGREPTFSDAGAIPAQTPGARPVVRLSGLEPGRRYRFAVQAKTGSSLSPMSAEVAIAVGEEG
jgi:hypothetical protein